MGHSLVQVILLARSDDVEKWMNILIVVVLAAFWGIANLIKAKKAQQAGKEEQPGRRPGQKPSPAIRALRERLLQQRAHARPAGPVRGPQYKPQARPRLSPAVRPQPAVKGQPIRVPIAAPPEKLSPLGATEIEASLKALPEPISKPIESLGEEHGPLLQEQPEQESIVESLLDYEDPDELRRAILHYEILGKPLSLRGSGEHVIGL